MSMSRRSSRLRLWTMAGLILIALVLSPVLTDARQYKTLERVSLSTSGVQGVNITSPVISDDGTIIAFWSDHEGLVPGDTNFAGDIFVRNRANNSTERVSLGVGGVQTSRPDNNPPVSYPDIGISNNGCIIVYASDATNIVPNDGDTNNTTDVFAVDRCTAGFPTVRVSVNDGGVQGNLGSTNPTVSGSGQFVVFRSVATDLVPNDTNNQPDVFIFDRTINKISRVNVASGGGQANIEDGTSEFSTDDSGLIVVFESIATNLVGGDTNGRKDIFIRDRPNDTTTRIMGLGGAQPNGHSTYPVVSGNGRWIAFVSEANNLVPNDTNGHSDVFLYDRNDGSIARVSVTSEGAQANGGSSRPSISGNGRFISFYSAASNLVDADFNSQPDIFVHDRSTNVTTRVSLGVDGTTQGNGVSGPNSAISDNGAFIAFDTLASNLVANDTNNSYDVFVAQGGPISPNNLTVTNRGETFVSLQWSDNSSDEHNFIVQRRQPGGTFGDRETLPPNTTTFTNTSLGECKVYEFRVQSTNSVARSPSNIVQVKTLGCPPGPFSLRSPSGGEIIINPARIDFRWDASEEASTYNLVATNTGTSATVISQPSLSHAALCDPVELRCTYTPTPSEVAALANGNYSWTVVATNSKGSTAASNNPQTFVVNDTLPPRDFELYTPAEGSFIRRPDDFGGFTWRDNKDANDYDLVVIEVSDNNTRLGTVIDQTELTPTGDGDGLTCDFDNRVCTYAPTPGEIAALSEGTFTWTVFAESPGNGRSESSTGAVVFKINLGDIEILVNGGFEINNDGDKVPDGWTVGNPTGDRLKCNKPDKTFTPHGNCTFRFKGNAGEKSKLKQILGDGGYNLTSGDQLQLNGLLRADNFPSGTAKVKFRITYAGDVFTPDKANFNVAGGTYGFTMMPPLNLGIDGPVSEIKVQVTSKATFGKLYLDEFSLLLLAPDSPRRVPIDGIQPAPSGSRLPEGGGLPDGVLPPPAAPPDFRGTN